jgi:putative tricarboxylic transport membrane protein
MSLKSTDVLRLAAPLAAAAAAAGVARDYIAPGVDLAAITRGIAGPATWPKVMLYGASACAAFIFLRNLLALRRSGASAAEDAEPAYDDIRLALGMTLLVGYGISINYVGMAWATLAFIASWLVLGGLRRPVQVLLVSTLGTAAILYLFVKISLMPLERGQGVFEQATIVLYRLLGIY